MGESYEPFEPVVDEQEGVEVGPFEHTENPDGTREYPNQELVETIDDPTPTPEVPAA